MIKRKTFSREFKLEAIRLMESGDRKSAELARELGVRQTGATSQSFIDNNEDKIKGRSPLSR